MRTGSEFINHDVIDWAADRAGRRTRVYDAPRAPMDRLFDAGMLLPAQEGRLREHRDALNPADLARIPT